MYHDNFGKNYYLVAVIQRGKVLVFIDYAGSCFHSMDVTRQFRRKMPSRVQVPCFRDSCTLRIIETVLCNWERISWRVHILSIFYGSLLLLHIKVNLLLNQFLVLFDVPSNTS